MRHYEQDPAIHGRVTAAKNHGPRDLFTRMLLAMQGDLYILSMPFRWIALPVQMLLREIVERRVWVLLIPLKILEWLVLAPTVGASLLWISRPWLRVFLVIPGLLLSRTGYILSVFSPPIKGSNLRELKLAFCDQWPLSWLIVTGVGPQGPPSGATVIEGEFREVSG